ncbi:hypothetical protein TNCT_841 [Trichonephila clavata]|uniref:Uncharacterized protein n=1 Tax=Trichonephila clavata TaxID=2740835 RepID=A0A8X6L302_TRICU|nr:hypothetical protein TNCT_841 [Trichonephila clavata]
MNYEEVSCGHNPINSTDESKQTPTLHFEQKLTEDGSESKEFRSVERFVTSQKMNSGMLCRGHPSEGGQSRDGQTGRKGADDGREWNTKGFPVGRTELPNRRLPEIRTLSGFFSLAN